jgi:hypothetical protein
MPELPSRKPGPAVGSGRGVPGQASGQSRQEFAERGGGGVAGGAPGGLVGAGLAVAQAAGGELGRVGETTGEGVLGGVLAAGVAGGDRSELKRSARCRAIRSSSWVGPPWSAWAGPRAGR